MIKDIIKTIGDKINMLLLTKRLDPFASLFDDNNLFPTLTKSSSNLQTYKYDNGNINIELSVPGYGKEDFDVSIKHLVLTMSSKDNKINKSFRLSEDVDLDSIECLCDKGILKVTAKQKDLGKEVKRFIEVK